ncbi:hypothetical protein [Paraburkholderia ginsengisoli]|uniref:Uncharacterized protein n=1 Tax=Paraburkholderia ginsengisoli TaxID=311231 RepID=A0A7T4TAW8_9BURK|nr:hypothetical protein [Paraburkholderia ginsengisoli]QQC66229.1 hypothetical protein I6I06_26000 [Paraburkholderia ginsengisoli]
MGNVLIVVSALAGALLFYVGAPSQRWLRAPLPARPARFAATACIALSLVCAARALQPATSLSVVVTMLMAGLTAYPFIGALLERRRARLSAR